MKNIILLATILCAVHIAYGRPNDKITGRHLLRKRSLALTAPVNSLVEDVSEATTFRDRVSKLRQLSQAGEMYPEHSSSLSVLARRKVIPKKVSITDDDTDDDSDVTDKKFKIRKDDDDASDDDKNSSDDSSDNDSSDDESGSGDEEDDNATTSEDSTDSDDEETAGASKTQCRKRCKTPLTFHQCAFPRCSQKLGTIKDLCFFLCKHQKTKCERVCE